MIRVGVYGYECTKVYEFCGCRIVPVYQQITEVRKLASDQYFYHLTAFLEITDDCPYEPNDLIFNLEGILCFIDHKDVIIKNDLINNESHDRLDDDFPKRLQGCYRINGGGCVIISDAFSENSRELFIKKSLNVLLAKQKDEVKEAFRSAFFRCVETFRGRGSFIDVSYYLLFSALESFCRALLDDYQPRCAIPIARVLVNYGFDVKQDNPEIPYKSIITYVHLRNALFHNCHLEKEFKNGEILKLSEYTSFLSGLVPLVLIKFLEFDDGYMNWNCWFDRLPFKK